MKRDVWRSWFWNVVLCLLLLVMAAIFTGLVFAFDSVAASLLLGAIAAVLWAGVVRAPLLSVIATARV